MLDNLIVVGNSKKETKHSSLGFAFLVFLYLFSKISFILDDCPIYKILRESNQ